MDFIKSKFDNICLLLLVVLVSILIYRADIHGGSIKLLDWLMQTATTILGAYIGLTQAARVAWKSNGGNGNGTKIESTVTGTGTVATSTTK